MGESNFAAFARLLGQAGIAANAASSAGTESVADAESIADALWLAQFYPPSPPRQAAPDGSPIGDRDPQVAPPPPAPPAGPGATAAPPEGAHRAEPRQAGGLYSGAFGASGESASDLRASPVNVPATSALPGALDIARALRPFNRRRPSPHRFALDEEATAESIAHFGFVRPVLLALPERWFDVALVVDGSRSMDVWQKTVQELEQLLAAHGAFGRVRRWRLVDRGEIQLQSAAGPWRPPAVLGDPRARTLILIVTNGVAGFWHSSAMVRILGEWSRRAPVAVAQLFSERHWPHTALGPASHRVRAPLPGAVNAKLDIERKRWERPAPGASRVVIPIFSFTPESIGRWAKSAMADGPFSTPAAVLSMAEEEATADPAAPSEPAALDPGARVDRFRTIASPAAFRLACLLTTVPLTLPIMRIVQRQTATLPRVEDLAAVLASGLIERLTPAEAAVDPDMVVYDFVHGVREVLSGALGIGTAIEVRAMVQGQLKEFIEHQIGRAIDNFRAFVLDDEGQYALPQAARSFVEIERRLLERFGVRPAKAGRQLLRGHRDRVTALAFRADGRLLASASTDCTVRVWDVAAGRETRILTAKAAVTAVAWSPDGLYLAAGAAQATILWEVATGREVRAFAEHASDVESVAFSPDGKAVASGSFGGSVRMWDPSSGKALRRLLPYESYHSLAFSPDGAVLAAGTDDPVCLWRAQDGLQIASLQGHSAPVRAVAFSPDGSTLASAASDRTIKLWDFQSGIATRTLHGDSEGIASLAWSPDGRCLATTSAHQEIRLWEARTGALLRTISTLPMRSLAFAPQAPLLAAGGEDGTIRLWDVADVRASRRALTGSAKTPQRLYVVHSGEQNRTLAEAVIEGLEQAGHRVLTDRDPPPNAVLLIGRHPADVHASHAMRDEYAIPWIAIKVDRAPGEGIEFGHEDAWRVGFDALLAKLDADLAIGPLVGVPALPDPCYPRGVMKALARRTCTVATRYFRVEGPRGAGCSTLAATVARDAEVRRTFTGGVYWMPHRLPSEDACLLIDPRFDLPQAQPAGNRHIFVDSNPRTLFSATVSLLQLQDLTPTEQVFFLEPIDLPAALSTPAIGRVALLARWHRILRDFGSYKVEAWLTGRSVPEEYGEAAVLLAMRCALDLLGEVERTTLGRLSPIVSAGQLPEALVLAVTDANSEGLERVMRAARSLDLVEPGDGIRPLRQEARAIFAAEPGAERRARRIADSYMRTVRQGTASVDERYFLIDIAVILSTARRKFDLDWLLRSDEWVERRFAAGGAGALIGDATVLDPGVGLELAALTRSDRESLSAEAMVDALHVIMLLRGSAPSDPVAADEPPTDPLLDPEWLAAEAEAGRYAQLLESLYQRRNGAALNGLYWYLVTSIRGVTQTWEQWFTEARESSVTWRDQRDLAPFEWHQLQWRVGAHLNDRARGPDPYLELPDSLLRVSRDQILETAIMRRWAVPRIASYYGFLFEPDMDRDEILRAPLVEELALARALLPWLQCVSWIAARTIEGDRIDEVERRLALIDRPSRAVDSDDDDTSYVAACKIVLSQHIQPWIALARLANDYVATRAAMPSGAERTEAMTDLVFSMQKHTAALEVEDYQRLLTEQDHAGRRLIAYAGLAQNPKRELREPLIATLDHENKPFGQYWALTALKAILGRFGGGDGEIPTPLQRLRSVLPFTSDRMAVLLEILYLLQPAPDAPVS